MTARREAIITRRRQCRDTPPDEPPVVMGVTPRPRGLARDPSRWGIVVAAAMIGGLDVIALAVVLTQTG